MPTQLCRIGLAMPKEEYDLLSRVARAREKSRAAVIMELFREVIPVLEQVVAIAELRDQAFNAPRSALRQLSQNRTAKFLELAEEAGDQMDMIVEQTIRDTVRSQRKGKGQPPGGVDGMRAASASRRPGKRPQRAVKRSGRGKRAG